MRLLQAVIFLLALAGSAWSADVKPIEFANGSRAWGDPYATPSATMDGPLVVLSGVVRVSKPGTFARLPVGMRPAQDIIIRQTKGTYAIRVDIKADGHLVSYGTGAEVGNWVSLDGLAFTTRLAEPLSLANGVTNYGDRFGRPQAWKHHDLVVLSGLIWAKHGLLTTLPSKLRPAEHQIIAAKTDAGTARLDVYPNGQVVWLNGPGRWVSLADVRFPTRTGDLLQPGAGYVHYADALQGDYGKARVLKMGTISIMSGLLFGLRVGEAIRLPPAIRTAENRLFAGFAGAGTPADNADVRMDSTPEGQVNLSEGGPRGGWLTVAGQVFAGSKANAIPLNTPVNITAVETDLRVTAASQSGAETAIGQCNAHTDACQWIFERSQTREGAYYIRRLGTALFLHAHGGTHANAKHTLHPCPKNQNYPNCQWRIEKSTTRDGALYIKSAGAALYVHNHGGNHAGAKQTLHPCQKASNFPNCQYQIQEPQLQAIDRPPAHTGPPLAADEQSLFLIQLRPIFNTLPVYGDLLRNAVASQFTEHNQDGFTWYEKTVRAFGQTLTLYLYRPKGAQMPNFALVTPQGISISVPSALATFEDIDALGALNARMALLGVTPGNETASLQATDLPPPLRGHMYGGAPYQALMAGLNAFGSLSFDRNSRMATLLGHIGANGYNFQASAGMAAKDACNANPYPGWSLRLQNPNLNTFFSHNLGNIRNAGFELRRVADGVNVVAGQTPATGKVQARAWGEGYVDSKSYFVYGQCTVKACKASNAIAFNPRQDITAEDYVGLVKLFGPGTVGTVGALAPDWDAHLGELPLDAVKLRSRHPNAGFKDGRLELDKLLGVFVGPDQSIEYTALDDAACVSGTAVFANGTGVILGLAAARLKARYWAQDFSNPVSIDPDQPVSVEQGGLFVDGTAELGIDGVLTGGLTLSIASDKDNADVDASVRVKMADLIDQTVNFSKSVPRDDGFELRLILPAVNDDQRYEYTAPATLSPAGFALGDGYAEVSQASAQINGAVSVPPFGTFSVTGTATRDDFTLTGTADVSPVGFAMADAALTLRPSAQGGATLAGTVKVGSVTVGVSGQVGADGTYTLTGSESVSVAKMLSGTIGVTLTNAGVNLRLTGRASIPYVGERNLSTNVRHRRV